MPPSTAHNLPRHRLKRLFSARRIERRVAALAAEIAGNTPRGELVIVAILKGSYVFLADLARHLANHDIHLVVDFLGLSSYGGNTTSSGSVTVRQDISVPLQGKTVLLMDDILDTGLTLTCGVALLKKHGARAVRTCVLLDKPARRRIPVTADHVGFTVDDGFVVGYGLDYDNHYRHLPYIAELITQRRSTGARQGVRS